MSGTVNISRDLWEDAAFPAEPFSRREAWVWMVAEASWKDRDRNVGGKVIDVKRGQLVASSRFLAKAWDWSEPKVRRFLDGLENRRMIGRVTDAGITVITLCNYDRYQNGGCDGDAETTQEPTRERRTTDANEKKGEIREDSGSASHSLGAGVQPADEIAEAVQVYSLAAERHGWPKIAKLTDARRKALRSRLRDAGGVDGWRAAVARAEASNFLCGGTGWSGFGFDWLVKQANFLKIMEGNYDNRSGGVGPARAGLAGGAQPGRGRAAASIASIVAQSRLGRQN